MDSAIDVASTIAPSDSLSQAPKPPRSSAPSKGGGPRKGPAKPSVDKDAPQGAVQVQPGGQSKTKKKSPVVSAAIPLSNWGEIDLYPFRRDIEPVVTVDSRPYSDLVDTVYTSIQSRYSSGGKHIPLALFRYYCYTMWWFRVLWLHKANANALRSDEKDFLNILLAGEEFHVPSPIAQYLGNLGNFLQGGEQYYFRMMSVPLSQVDADDAVVKKGWFETSLPGNKVDASTWWLYAQFPSPGVYSTFACNEANSLLQNPLAPLNFDSVAPDIKGAVAYPTDNIVGWNNAIPSAQHSSWRATYSLLGWSATSVPSDVQTNFNVSTSTLKWMSERLSTLKDFKLNSSSQLVLSVQGSPIFANYLGIEDVATQVDQRPPVADVASNRMNGSRFSEFAVSSRYAIDPATLAPSFSFGYRIQRTQVFKKQGPNRSPEFESRSNFQPWLFASDEAYFGLSPAWFTGMNAPFDFGSQSFLNVRRFSTHQLLRSVGLDAALVLSDTR